MPLPVDVATLCAPRVRVIDAAGRPALIAWTPPCVPSTRWRH